MGAEGDTGAAGAMGAVGVTGAMGAMGVAGAMGATGVAGAMGATGVAGGTILPPTYGLFCWELLLFWMVQDMPKYNYPVTFRTGTLLPVFFFGFKYIANFQY